MPRKKSVSRTTVRAKHADFAHSTHRKSRSRNSKGFFQHLSQLEMTRLFGQILEHTPAAILIVDPSGKVSYVNSRFSQLIGYLPTEIVDQNLETVYQRAQAPEMLRLFNRAKETCMPQQSEFQLFNRQGIGCWESMFVVPSINTGGRISHLLGFLRDISARMQSERIIQHITHHDQLTDLPNRSLFTGHLARALEQAGAAGQRLAVVLLDLDRFKVINDTLGHSVGDQLIQSVASRLQERLGVQNMLARMGGDEFIVLLPSTHHFMDLLKNVQTLMGVFHFPFICDGHELHINASIGISVFPDDGEDPPTLLKNADVALYEAKNSGRNHYKFFTAKLNERALDQLTMETALRHALDEGQFRVFYQPQVNSDTGRIESMEALVRWEHPQLGLLAPDRFITLAEETGLIVPLGEWVLRDACKQTVAWHQNGFPNLRVAVNLSARQFLESELVEKVLGICQDAGLDPAFLELEITESILAHDLSVTTMLLQWLNKKGVSIAIDDFGTGYSSLKYLKRFPIHTLKIDRSFIRECLSNTDDAAIVTTIASIAHNLHLHVIAEGIETPEQLQFIRQLGCQHFQGYLFSPPRPADECIQLLQNQSPLSPQDG